ncbi:MAG: Zn-dependent hydrolase [Alphaproteobacteria bacterium]|nr:Zn-dependent hydrolase [Alphaproteobacteria bacterium]
MPEFYSTLSNVSINPDRLWQSHMEMAKHGATQKGGVNRQALTVEDGAARNLFQEWCEDAGCQVEIDAAGNIFARRPGLDPDAEAVCTGSHLDTQPTGGRFDGAFGVLAGLEVVRSLNDAAIETRRPIDVVVWTNEEGTRFPYGGSAVFAGLMKLETVYDTVDSAGTRFEDALTAIGAKGNLPCGFRRFDSVFEAHIEQGPLLERQRLSVGIVTGARGQLRYDVSVTGQEGHAGTMPMDMRRDALTAAARLVVRLEEIGLSHLPQGVCTVGALTVAPNSIKTIPGRVRFSIDLRHPTAAGLAAMESAISEAFAAEQARDQVIVESRILEREPPINFDPDLVQLLRQSAESCGIAAADIFSMAGHDSCYLAPLQPTAMVFVPCRDGLSHNELESATPSDLADGTRVLATAMLARAGRV